MKLGKVIWCGQEPLCISFDSLFSMVESKDTWVIAFGVGLTRLSGVWEVEVDRLLSLLLVG